MIPLPHVHRELHLVVRHKHLKLDLTLTNPVGVLVFRWRVRRLRAEMTKQRAWVREQADADLFNDQFARTKWTSAVQLATQFVETGDPVYQVAFSEACRTRGFNPRMELYSRFLIDAAGLRWWT